jgi:hypothetical protein
MRTKMPCGKVKGNARAGAKALGQILTTLSLLMSGDGVDADHGHASGAACAGRQSANRSLTAAWLMPIFAYYIARKRT